MTKPKRKGKSQHTAMISKESEIDIQDGKGDNEAQPKFSYHILANIVQHLAWIVEDLSVTLFGESNAISSKADLNSCSLVCRAFLNLCRPHIFGSIKLNVSNRGAKPSLAQLATLIKSNPSVATYVEEVSCQFSAKQSIKVKDVPGLPVLFSLPNVRKLSIHTDESARDLVTLYHESTQNNNLAWRTTLDLYIMSQNLTAINIGNTRDPPMLDLLVSPVLETLELRRCSMSGNISISEDSIPFKGFKLKRLILSEVDSFQLSLLSYCPALEEIDFFEVSPAKRDTPPGFLWSVPFASFRRLRKVTSQGGFDLSFLCQWAEFAGLRVFPALKDISVILTDENEVQGVGELFTFSPSLEKLYIENSREIEITELDLGRFIRISRFTLKDLWLDYGAQSMDEAGTRVKTFCDILKLVRKDNILEEITFRVDGVQCMDAEMLRPRSVKQWEHLDAVLLDRDDDFPCLREVVVCFETFVYSAKGSDGKILDSDLEDFLKRPLKGLFATKCFDFRSRVNLHRI